MAASVNVSLAVSRVLAVDLEGTLISNAMSQIPRPGLREFLETCASLYPRVVLYTAVPAPRVDVIIRLLVDEGTAPPWFAQTELVQWSGPTKDLTFIRGVPPAQAVLVDDNPAYVHPGQELHWVRVEEFCHPYPEDDTGLADILPELRRRAGASEEP